MAKKPTLDTIESGYQSTASLNSNFTALRDAFDNTLSLDGSTPNAMNAALDLNNNNILNIDSFQANSITLGGQTVNLTDIQTLTTIAGDIQRLADIEDGTLDTNAIQEVATIYSDVSTVSGIAANVTTVAGNTTNINTVAGINSNVTTVAGISGDVTTVSGISADVTTVAADGVDIGVVAGISSDVTTVSGINADVTTVSGISANVTTVAGNTTNINTVAGVSAAVTTVSGISSDVSTVSGISANVTTVAGISTSVPTVATISADVTTVATISTDVSAVSAIDTNVTTVAGISGNVTTVAGVASSIPTVAGISTDVTTVAGISGNVSTVAGVSTDVTTVAGISTDVTTVATNNANVTTVAGISANVTTVAGIASDVTTVASDSAVINTVATAITDVSTVSADIASVITAANDLNEAVSEIETVAASIANVDLVGADITNVNTVATDISNVNTTAGSIANVNTVSGSIANVNTVATNILDVNTVAGISSDVTTVAADGTDIGTVATDIANVNTVAGSITNVNTTATNISDVTTVAGEIGVTGDVTIVAAQLGAGGAVTNVSAAINNVITVSQNLANVNNFAEVYRISVNAPTTSLDTGDLWYDTANTALKVYDGSQWTQGVLSGSGFLPLTGGTMSGDISMAGNDIYTNNGDLQMGTGIIYGNTFSGNATTATKLQALSTNPTNDSIVFFDTSAGNYAYLTIGSNLTLSGTTLSADTQSPTAGAGITVSGTQVNHADTSSQASVNNSDGTVIQDITIDTFGHITGIQSNNLDNRFLRSDANDTATGSITFSNASGITIGEADIFHQTNSTWRGITVKNNGDTNEVAIDGQSSDGTQRLSIYGETSSQGFLNPTNNSWKLRLPTSGSFTRDNTYTIWDSGNDGSGSGLDADTVDGIQGSSFLRSDANDTASGSYSFTNSYNEFGNSTGSVSNDGNWNARLNLAGSGHARLDVKSVSDGIITTMYSHTGQGVGKVGTYSNHPLVLMTNGASSATLNTSGTLTATAFVGDGSGLTNLPGGTASNTYQVGAHYIGTGSGNATTGWDTDGDASATPSDASNLWVRGDDVPLTSSNRGVIAIDDLNSGDIIGGLEWVNNDFISAVVRGNSGFNSRWISKGRQQSTSTDQHYGALIMDGYFGLTYTHSSWNWTGSANMPGEQVFVADQNGITATAFVVASDIRLKENLVVIPDAVDKVSQLNGYSYTTIDTGVPKYGVVAQEVEVVMPHSVKHRLDVPDTPEEDLIKTVDYPSLIPLLIEAIKEQQSTITALEARITALEG